MGNHKVSQEPQKIPPKSEWPTLPVTKLYEVRSDMIDLSYRMRAHGASYAGQYTKLIGDLDTLISIREVEAVEAAKAEAPQN